MYLVDAAGPFLVIVPLIFLIFCLICVLLEASVIRIFINKGFGKCFVDSLIANSLTTLVGWALINALDLRPRGISFLVFFFLSVLLEGVVLFLRNRKEKILKVALAAISMNVVTYIILAVLIFLTH